MHLQPYLIFPGTCREALTFYAEVLGGTITHIQTVADSPLPAAAEHGDRIFHSIFEAGDIRFMASDGQPGKDPQVGHNFALFVTCPDEERQTELFEALKAGGRVFFTPDTGLGMVEDRFEIRWMIAREGV